MASIRRWAARLLVLGVALASAVAVVLLTTLAVLDDNDYRSALIWAADRYLDATLAIEDELSIELGPTVGLRAQGLRLTPRHGRYEASAAELDVRLQLWHLLSNTIWLDRVTIVGARVDIDRSADEAPTGRAAGYADLRNIIVRQARLLDLHVAYRDARDGLHEAQIERLLIKDPLDQGPVQVDGRGIIDSRPVELAGTLGSHGQLIDKSIPYPVALQLTSDRLSIALTGSIADPLAGRGVALQLRANDPDPAGSLRLLAQSLPTLGALTLEAEISGDYDALALEQLSLRIQRPNAVDIQANGRIANLQALSGVALEINGTVDDPELWQWLTAAKLPGFHRGVFNGEVTGHEQALRISDLAFETSGPSGLMLNLQGQLALDLMARTISDPALDLALKLSAPELATIGPLVDQELPALGPVELSTRLTGGAQQLRFETLNATIGTETDHYFVFTDGRGQLDLDNAHPLQQAQLPMQAKTPRPAVVSRLFGMDIPALGPTRVDGTWKVDGLTVTLAGFDARVELVGDSMHRLSGDIVHRIGKTTTADIAFDLDTDALLALWSGDTPGELGRIAGTMDLLRSNDSWQLRRIGLASKDTALFAIDVAGQDVSQGTGRPNEMTLRLRVDDPPTLFETAGLEPLPLAPIEATGTLTVNEGRYRYLSDLRVGTSTARLDLTARLQDNRPILNGEFRTQRLTLGDLGLQGDGEPASAPKKTAPDTDATDAKPPQESKPLFSREPIDLTWLRGFDLDFAIAIDELRGNRLDIDDIRGRVMLESGRLRLTDSAFQYLGGKASGTYELDARAIPVLKVDIKADNLVLSDILDEFLTDTFDGGILDLALKLEGRGNSPHELASSLDGDLDMAFEKTSIPANYVQFLSADVFGWTLSQTALAERTSFIDCGLIGLDAESGKVKSRALLVDSPDLSTTGDISLDLAEETLDMVVLPEQKKRLSVFRKATPVKLTGSLHNPTVEAIPARAAAERVGGLVLLPQVFIPLEVISQVGHLFSRHADDSEGCSKVLGRSVTEGFAFEGAKPATNASED